MYSTYTRPLTFMPHSTVVVFGIRRLVSIQYLSQTPALAAHFHLSTPSPLLFPLAIQVFLPPFCPIVLFIYSWLERAANAQRTRVRREGYLYGFFSFYV